MLFWKKRKCLSVLMCLLCGVFLTGCGEKNVNTSGKKQENTKKTQEQVSLPTRAPETMRELSSMELVKEMGVGWNLGNTLDVCQADRDGDGNVNETAEEGKKVDETLWGNPKATKELFEALKEDGVKSVRIPVTWRDHMDDENGYKVDAEWMSRVQEVVDYAYDLDMYVIINVHHDGGGDPEQGAWIRNASKDHDAVMEKYIALWEQIAEHFKNYSERLIFESMNEVGFDDLPRGEAFDLLGEFNQTFVDLVRKSGGNNETRHLLIAGYWTDVGMTCKGGFTMPTDVVEHTILSLHYYTPWTFCTTNSASDWGSEDEVRDMKANIDLVKETFVDKGVPVLIGEYGVGPNEPNSCIFFCEMFVKLCTDAGVPTYFWDNGEFLNRTTYEWRNEKIIEGIVRAASGEEYTPEKVEIGPTQITKISSDKAGELSLVWDKNPGAGEYTIAGYEVGIGKDPGCIKDKQLVNVGADVTSYTFEGLESGVEYYAHFRAITADSTPIHGDWSKAVPVVIK